MAVAVGVLLLGILLLYLGAEWLVKGAAGLARELGVPPLVIGLTVVAYGTSAPELVVSSIAVLAGEGELALGNVIGSNIANIGLILGLTALISPIQATASLLRWELPVLMLCTVAVPLFLMDGAIGRPDAGILFGGALAFTVITVRTGSSAEARRSAALVERDAELAGAPSGGGTWRLALIAAVGLGLLVGGGRLFVLGATDLALLLGMSERTVGLTIVAVGTSLPELAASLIAALRGHSAIAVGNVLGSNIFNVTFVLGGAGLVRPIEGSVFDMRLALVVLGGMTLAMVVFLRTERTVSRTEGGLLLAAYAGFIVLIGLV